MKRDEAKQIHIKNQGQWCGNNFPGNDSASQSIIRADVDSSFLVYTDVTQY